MKKISLLLASALLIVGLSVQAQSSENADPNVPPPHREADQVEAGVSAAGCMTCTARYTSKGITSGNSYSNALPDDYAKESATKSTGADGTK